MKKLLITVLFVTGAIHASGSDTEHTPQTNNYKQYSASANKKMNEGFDERLQAGLIKKQEEFKRRPSVIDFATLETDYGTLPDRPQQPGDATQLLNDMYKDALNDVMNLLGWNDEQRYGKPRNPNLLPEIVLAVAEKHKLNKKYIEEKINREHGRFKLFLFPEDDKRTQPENTQHTSTADRIKKLTDFQNDVILAHADLGIDLRDQK